jgi:hypothetical protein
VGDLPTVWALASEFPNKHSRRISKVTIAILTMLDAVVNSLGYGRRARDLGVSMVTLPSMFISILLL